MKKKMKGINDVGKLIKPLWPEAEAHGRCWGKKGNGQNPLYGSHITLIKQDEVVTVFFDEKKNKFRILEYRLSEGSVLGEKIKNILTAHGVDHC